VTAQVALPFAVALAIKIHDTTIVQIELSDGT